MINLADGFVEASSFSHTGKPKLGLVATCLTILRVTHIVRDFVVGQELPRGENML